MRPGGESLVTSEAQTAEGLSEAADPAPRRPPKYNFSEAGSLSGIDVDVLLSNEAWR